MKKINEGERLPYSLVGIDGNAFSVMGYVMRAMKENGYSKEACEAYKGEAMSGDYDHLLALSVAAIDKINKENGYDDMAQLEKGMNARQYVDYNQGISNPKAQIIDEGYEFDPYTFMRYILKGIARAIESYQEEQESDVDPDEVTEVLKQISPDDINNVCGEYDINLNYNKEHHNHRISIHEGQAYPEYDEANDLNIDVEDEFLKSKSLMPINKNQRCLYIEAEDFENLGIDEDTFVKFLEKETFGTTLEGIIWKNNVQFIIDDEYEFNKLMDKMKEELGISRVDLQPYIYRADEMRPIIAASYKERYK